MKRIESERNLDSTSTSNHIPLQRQSQLSETGNGNGSGIHSGGPTSYNNSNIPENSADNAAIIMRHRETSSNLQNNQTSTLFSTSLPSSSPSPSLSSSSSSHSSHENRTSSGIISNLSRIVRRPASLFHHPSFFATIFIVSISLLTMMYTMRSFLVEPSQAVPEFIPQSAVISIPGTNITIAARPAAFGPIFPAKSSSLPPPSEPKFQIMTGKQQQQQQDNSNSNDNPNNNNNIQDINKEYETKQSNDDNDNNNSDDNERPVLNPSLIKRLFQDLSSFTNSKFEYFFPNDNKEEEEKQKHLISMGESSMKIPEFSSLLPLQQIPQRSLSSEEVSSSSSSSSSSYVSLEKEIQNVREKAETNIEESDLNSLYSDTLDEDFSLMDFLLHSLGSMNLTELEAEGFTRQLAIVDTLGCHARIGYQNLRDKIALVERGSCSFYEKVLVLQEWGADAVIVGDSVYRRGLITMYSTADPDMARIPSVFISKMSYDVLKAIAERNKVEGKESPEITISVVDSGGPVMGPVLFLLVSPLFSLSIIYGILLFHRRYKRVQERAPKWVVDKLPRRVWTDPMLRATTQTAEGSSTTPNNNNNVENNTELFGNNVDRGEIDAALEEQGGRNLEGFKAGHSKSTRNQDEGEELSIPKPVIKQVSKTSTTGDDDDDYDNDNDNDTDEADETMCLLGEHHQDKLDSKKSEGREDHESYDYENQDGEATTKTKEFVTTPGAAGTAKLTAIMAAATNSTATTITPSLTSSSETSTSEEATRENTECIGALESNYTNASNASTSDDTTTEHPTGSTDASTTNNVNNPVEKIWVSAGECIICLEDYVNGESVVLKLPCGHEFHEDCIRRWLLSRKKTCPICKMDVTSVVTKELSILEKMILPLRAVFRRSESSSNLGISSSSTTGGEEEEGGSRAIVSGSSSSAESISTLSSTSSSSSLLI